MIHRLLTATTVIGVCLIAALAYGQQSTELFIPIGQSPGLSGEATVIGKIDVVDAGNRTVTLSDATGTYKAAITQQTKIYLDRSRLNRNNRRGSWDDLKSGMLAEVYYGGKEPDGAAEWIKLRIE